MVNQKKPKEAAGKNLKKKEGIKRAAATVPLTDAYGDVSGFGISAEEMVKRCRESGRTAWAYARVSTKAQDLARQVDRFTQLGIDMEHIIKDKATGTNFERDGFRQLLGLAQEGDIIIFTELDRFGRDFLENVNVAMRITLEKKVGIGFTEHPELNRMGRQSESDALVSMMMFLVRAYSSFEEHGKIMSRTSQGRRLKAKAGAAFGRKPREIAGAFWEMEGDILSGRVSLGKAGKELEVNYRTLKKWVRHARKRRMKKEVEGKMLMLSKKAGAWLEEAQGTGASAAAERVSEVKGLVGELIANMGKLAESLSAWRRVPVVDGDGAIIRPETYQRKETEQDDEVKGLEAGIEGLSLFADGLVRVLESSRAGVPAFSLCMDGAPPGSHG
ncbi:MAG: recombinase family protein, partial [Lachnospiraceae bacterium]|nr:recombinase family protein [Lachnospiraceae bacterium]